MTDVAELIHRRRRQVLVHSIIYYKMNESIIPDATFDAWAQELALLQDTHPEASEAVEYHLEAFRGFAGETGFHLPLWDGRAQKVAKYLLTLSQEGAKL